MMPRCRGNWGCDEKRQTEVAWTCRKKGRCRLCDGMYSTLLVKAKAPDGRPKKTWQNTLSGDMYLLLKVYPRDVHNQNKWRAIGRHKATSAESGTLP